MKIQNFQLNFLFTKSTTSLKRGLTFSPFIRPQQSMSFVSITSRQTVPYLKNFDFQFSTFDFRLSTIDFRLSTFDFRLSTFKIFKSFPGVSLDFSILSLQSFEEIEEENFSCALNRQKVLSEILRLKKDETGREISLNFIS